MSEVSGGLVGTTWTLVAFEADGHVIPAMTVAPATLVFVANPGSDQAGRVSGTGGCNRYFGSYTLAGERLSVTTLGATRMACSEDRMAQEEQFFQALQAAERYELYDGALLVMHNGGTLRFVSGLDEQSE